jgi:hypothetical protein
MMKKIIPGRRHRIGGFNRCRGDCRGFLPRHHRQNGHGNGRPENHAGFHQGGRGEFVVADRLGQVKGLVVGNPEGYKTPQAISVGSAAVGVNPFRFFRTKSSCARCAWKRRKSPLKAILQREQPQQNHGQRERRRQKRRTRFHEHRRQAGRPSPAGKLKWTTF